MNLVLTERLLYVVIVICILDLATTYLPGVF